MFSEASPFAAEFCCYQGLADQQGRQHLGDLPRLHIGRLVPRQIWSVIDLALAVVALGPGPCTYRFAEIDANHGTKDEILVCSMGDVLDLGAMREASLEKARVKRALKLFKLQSLGWQEQPLKRKVVRRKRAQGNNLGEALTGTGVLAFADPACEEDGDGDSSDSEMPPHLPPPCKEPDDIEKDAASVVEGNSKEPSPDTKPGVAAPKGKPRPGPRPNQSLDSFVIGDVGHIKVDVKRRQFNAHCNCLGPPAEKGPPHSHNERMQAEQGCHQATIGIPSGVASVWQVLRQQSGT